MKFKREYELAIFGTIIIISIAFSLYYAGFTGELPTGAAFADSDGDGISDQTAIACAALACPLCGSPFALGADTDGNGIPDSACAAGSCQVAAAIPCPELGGDNDGDFAPTQIEVDAYADFSVALNGAQTYVGCALTGATATTWDYNCFSSDGFTFSPASLAAVFSGSAICSAGATGANTFQVACTCPASDTLTTPLAFSWDIPIGDSPAGLQDTRPGPVGPGYVVTSDDPSTYFLDMTGTGTCPATGGGEPRIGGGTGGSNDCQSEVRNVWWSGDVLMVELAVRQQMLMAGVTEEEVADMFSPRVSYPLDGVMINSVAYVGPENLMPGIYRTNVRRIYRVGVTGLTNGDRLDLIGVVGNAKWGWDPNKCFDGIIVPEKPLFEKPLPPCTQQQIVDSVEVTAENVAVDGDLFSFNLNTEFTLPDDCFYTGTGVVTLNSYQLVGPDGIFAIDASGKKGKGGTIGPGGFVSGGGIGSYTPGGSSAAPGGPTPPPEPVPSGPDKLDISIIVTGVIDGMFQFNTPIVVTTPIPHITTTEVPTTTIDIPDEDIPKFFDTPYPGPGFIPTPEPPFPNPAPYPNPTPFPDPIPDVIKKIFYPQPRGEYVKLYADTVQFGEVSTDEGKKIDQTKAFQLTNGAANGRVAVYGPWGVKDEVVHMFLEKDGKEVSALRAVIPRTEAVPGLKVMTEQVLPLGQYTVGEWGSNIPLRTNTEGGAFYQMDYNNLEDGKYSLIAVSGNKVKMFYFEIANGQVIFLEVPPKKLIANLKLVARELGIPTTIKRLGGDEITLYYKDKNWNNEAGERTVIPDDLT